MRIASLAAFVALGALVVATPVNAEAPEGRWSGFTLGLGIGVADVESSARLSATGTTTTSSTCTIVPNNQPGAIFGSNCAPDPALFPNGNVGTVSAPFDVISAATNQVSRLVSGDIGGMATASIGYDVRVSPSFIVGAFADVSVTNAKADLSLSGPVANLSGQLQFDYLATAGGRLGWIVPSKDGLLYVYGGYTYADAGGSEATVTTSLGSSAVKFDNFQGFSVGGGGEVQLGKGWFARLEYRYTHLNSQKFSFSQSSSSTVADGVFAACGGPAGVDCQKNTTTQSATSGSGQIDPEIHAVRMTFGYRF